MSIRESRAVVRGSAHKRSHSKEIDPPSMSDATPLRIVLLGKSVSENSRVGNFILGRSVFDSKARPDVVERVGGRLKHRRVILINSPQLLHTNISDHQITQTARECVSLSDPGPHVVLLLLQHEQCSAEDQERVEKLLDSFSERLLQHSMVLSTQEPTETNEILQKIIHKCSNRHFSLQRSSSPDDLLQALEDIEQSNEGRHLLCAQYEAFSEEKQRYGERLNVVVCGSDGSLKSSISELIQQQTHKRSESVRTDVDLLVNVLELPALSNTGLSEEEVMRQTLRCVSLCHPGVHAFLLIIPDAPLNIQDRAEMEEIKRIFSSRINKHLMILIKQNSEHQTAELNEETQAVIESFGGRHHFCGPKTQVSTLMENIEQMLEENRGGFFSIETFLEAQMEKLMKYEEMKRKIHSMETHLLESRVNTDDEVRIVLLGKTGVGKSATGNTILGRKAFKAEASFESVTKVSLRESGDISGRQVTVIDTPGLFDTELTNEEIQTELSNCISMILPGPHVFIIVLSLGQRFTKVEETAAKIIQETFGENSLMFTMVLFTRGDFLGNKTIEQCLGKPGSPLMNLIEACGNRFHVFNNNQTEDRTQVSDLLEKIDNMVKANGGSFYSCKMFREMERERQEQQMKILMDRVREAEEEMKKLMMMMEEERHNHETERKRREEELKREIREEEKHQREIQEQMKRERETFRHEIEEMRKEKEKIKTEKDNLRTEYQTETDRLMNRIENERKKREEEYTEKEEQYKTLIKEKEEKEKEMKEEMRKEKEKLQIRYDSETDRLMNRIEKERQNHETERKRREEEFNEREERYKRLMTEKEEREEKMQEEMKREREEWEKLKKEEKKRRQEEDEKRENDVKEFKERMKREKEDLQLKNKEEENKMKMMMEKLNREREELMKHEEEREKMKMVMEEERQNHETERKRREEELKREIREEEKHQREIRDQMKRERETFRHEIEEMRKEKEKIKTEKDNLRTEYQTETDRLMNRIENERQNHETERKRREEVFNEREERYKRLMKESEENMQEEMKREREEWEKLKEEEKKRRQEEDEKRREKEQREFNERLKEERERMEREKEDLQSKNKEEENKMKVMVEEERQNHETERKRREEEFREREERYKRLIKEREQKENEMLEQMKMERMQWQKQKEGEKREEEKKEQEKIKSKCHKRHQSPVRALSAGLNLVLLGTRGAGKSASGNTILGRQSFIIKKSSKSVTRDVAVESGSFCELPLTVYDTPGLSDIDMREEEEFQQMISEKVLQRCESERCVFLLVIKADRFTEEERKTVEKIEKILGEKHLKNTWILFTGEDQLEEENTTIQEFIDDNEELKTLVQKYDHRYHVFNNKKKGPSQQVKILFTKILKLYLDIMAREETLSRIIPEYVEADTRVSSPPSRRIVLPQADTRVSSPPSRRIVLVGKRGVGKSAAGNTILGQREFRSVMSSYSVTSVCLVKEATVSGRSVSVVDTPGLFDTKMKPEESMMEISRSVYISSPGPHAFLIVFSVNMRFTEQEQQIPQLIEMMFGEEVLKYSIILLTHGDLLEGTTVEKLIQENGSLRAVVQQCGGRYQLFNNKDLNNREQVNDLLQKIDSMIQQNGGGHYSNQIFEDAQRFRQEEEEERRREEEERKQQEEIERAREEIERAREEIERVRKEPDERTRREYEHQMRKQQEEKQNCVCS